MLYFFRLSLRHATYADFFQDATRRGARTFLMPSMFHFSPPSTLSAYSSLRCCHYTACARAFIERHEFILRRCRLRHYDTFAARRRHAFIAADATVDGGGRHAARR